MTDGVSEKSDVYRGHFDECISHFKRAFDREYPPSSRNRLKSGAQTIADFCGVDLTTVGDWLASGGTKHRIIGLSYVRMVCFLDLNGYKIIELERLPPAIRKFAELIGYNVVSVDKATSTVGFTQPAEFYALLRGTRTISKDRESRMWGFWKQLREQLEHNKREALKKHLITFRRQPVLGETIAISDATKLSGLSQTSGHRVVALHLMHGLRVLLDEGIFDSLSESEAEEMSNVDKMCIAQIAAHTSVLGVRLMKGKKV